MKNLTLYGVLKYSFSYTAVQGHEKHKRNNTFPLLEIFGLELLLLKTTLNKETKKALLWQFLFKILHGFLKDYLAFWQWGVKRVSVKNVFNVCGIFYYLKATFLKDKSQKGTQDWASVVMVNPIIILVTF